MWAGAVLVGPQDETPLSALTPVSGHAAKAAPSINGQPHPDALLVTLPTDLVYNLRGAGYTRLRATVGLDDPCRQDDISPAVRFFVFKEKPDMQRLVQVSPAVPAPTLQAPRAKSELVASIFQYMLDRAPSRQEQKLAAEALGPGREIKPEGLADLLWSVAMQPEFQLIY